MANKLDQILVVDVESTCWEEEPPKGEKSEIIEIGVCVINVPTLERVIKQSIFVRPVESTVSRYCTNLTSLTQENLENGLLFRSACAILKEHYRSKKIAWASWGDYDRKQFGRVCERQKVDYPFGPTHLNVKTLFALQQGLQREVGMAEALQRLGMPLEGRHHSGMDDAWNIAALLCYTVFSR